MLAEKTVTKAERYQRAIKEIRVATVLAFISATVSLVSFILYWNWDKFVMLTSLAGVKVYISILLIFLFIVFLVLGISCKRQESRIKDSALND